MSVFDPQIGIKVEDSWLPYHGVRSPMVWDGRDIPIGPNKGRVLMIGRENGKVIKTYENNNLIVYTADLLAAEVLSGTWSVPAITHLALGVGSNSWNPQNPPPPDRDQATLENELFRTAVTPQFIDPNTGDPMDPQQVLDENGINTQRTWLVDFVATIGAAEANGALKEMGLFGGVAASEDTKGTLINYFTFPVWNKVLGQVLDIIWRISFRHTQYVPEFGTCSIQCQTACELNCQISCQTTCQDVGQTPA